MTILKIPHPLRTYTSGQSEVNVTGEKISEALTDHSRPVPCTQAASLQR